MKFAFVFPGQGSQSVGMMQGYADSTAVRELLTLKGAIGVDRLKIVRPRGYAVKIFEVTGLGEHLPLVDDPADAPPVEATSRDAAG